MALVWRLESRLPKREAALLANLSDCRSRGSLLASQEVLLLGVIFALAARLQDLERPKVEPRRGGGDTVDPTRRHRRRPGWPSGSRALQDRESGRGGLRGRVRGR